MTLIVALLATISPTLAVVVTYWLSQRDRQRKSAISDTQLAIIADATNSQLTDIHVLVNGRLHDALQRIAELEAQLEAPKE